MDIFQGVLISAFFAFFLAAAFGPLTIAFLRKLRLGQSVRSEGPKSHMKKSGVPTMGGIIFLSAIEIASFVIGQFDLTLFLLTFCTVGFGLIGFVDDAIKIKKRNSDGLSVRGKLISQTVISSIFAIVFVNNFNPGTNFILPFFDEPLDLKWAYVPVIIFLMVGIANGANFTDGLDGLASSVTIPIGVFFCIASIMISRNIESGFMSSSSLVNYNNVGMFCGALCGGVGGFLIYNSYPAKVIMGDTGSLALGGAIASIAVLLNLSGFLLLVGFIYTTEILSVILQVASYKLTGRRVFRMAPVHHHFELCGWSENRIVFLFSFITAVLCIVGVFLL